jgi:hypothetical protein
MSVFTSRIQECNFDKIGLADERVGRRALSQSIHMAFPIRVPPLFGEMKQGT